VPLFYQYAGPYQPLTDEFKSFDQYWEHPSGNGYYVSGTTTRNICNWSLVGLTLSELATAK
ncbi:hypothetical protein BN863_18580, partial [Formosa agariphila KMM 3901]